MLETLLRGALAANIVNNTSADEERFKAICGGAPLNIVEKVGLGTLVESIGIDADAAKSVFSIFGINA